MEFLVLGPVELCGDDGPVDLGSDRVRGILALLLLNLGVVMPTERLIELIWDENPPPKARGTLASHVTRLRRLLETGGGGASIENRAHGYVLRADRARVDLYRFQDLRREASSLARRGEVEAAAALLRHADELWRGPALAGLSGDAIAQVRHGLEEERWAGIRQRIEYDLACGNEAELIGELAQLSAARGSDQSLAATLTLCLYRVGRQADALATYLEFRERHIRDQGTEPGEALAALHARILRRDPSLMARAESRLGVSGRPELPDTLPPDPQQFIGRAAEIHQLVAPADGPGVQAITGMPGVGKSGLALRVAHALREQFPDGWLFLGLCAHDVQQPPLEPAEALRHLLLMIGIQASRIPHVLSDRVALWRSELSRRRLIVVLDDAAGASQVQPLLPVDGSASRVLITSRMNLGIEPTLSLMALGAGDAADLFARIAGPVTNSAGAKVAEIVRLCGGLPLAIHLSARRLRDADPSVADAVLDEVAEELSSGTAGSPDTELHGREIALTFEMSYRSLSPSSRIAFRRLSQHPGTDVSEYAAAALTGTSLSGASASLSELVGSHMLEAAGKGFRFHDLIRQYAVTCALRDDPEHERRAAADRLLHFYLYAVEQSERVLRPHAGRAAKTADRPFGLPNLGTPRDAVAWLELEWPSILNAARQAAARERKHECARLIHMLAGFLRAAGHWRQATEAHQLAVQACRDLDDRAGLARASLDLSQVAGQAGDLPGAFRHAERAAATFKAVADWAGHADALNHLGELHRFAAQYRQALAYYQEAGQYYREAGEHQGLAATLNHSAIVCYHLGRYPEVLIRLDAALRIYCQIGDRRGEATALANLGTQQRYQGLHRDAMDSYQRSLEIIRELGGEQQMEAQVYLNIGCVRLYKKSYGDAMAACQRALTICRQIGDLPGESLSLSGIGDVLNAREERAEALAHHRQAADIAKRIGDSFCLVAALRGIAEALCGTDRDDEAAEHYQQALQLAKEIGESSEEARVLEGMARAALQAQDTEMARIYLQQALDIYEQLGLAEAEAVQLRLEMLPPGHVQRRDIA